MPPKNKGSHVRVSKLLSSILRHRGVQLGLTIREDGYTPLGALLALPAVKKLGADFAVVQSVVEQNGKQRFSLKQERDGYYWIRANQGHSMKHIKSDALLTRITNPADYRVCVHGTYWKAWSQIKRTGLNKMARQHIHFSSKDFRSQDIISGMRGNCQVLVHVDMAKAMRDGLKFYISSNEVILSEGQDGVIAPKYFSKVVEAQTGRTVSMDEDVVLESKKKTADDTVQSFDYLAIIDFEATCTLEKGRSFVQEIIEFPCVLVDAKTGKIHAVFHHYIKPRHTQKLTEFCKELTKISQATVDHGIDIADCLDRFDAFLRRHDLAYDDKSGNAKKTVAFVTCGDWDLKSMLPRQCQLLNRRVPRYFTSWINIKKSFQDKYSVKAGGMAGMLRHLKMPLVGTHHSGIDDSKNIASIAVRMLGEGFQFRLTSSPSHTQKTQKRRRKYSQ